MQWCADTKKVGLENINLIQPSGLVEAALVCLNLWFCLLLNIPLHCHNIDKSDKNKWQLLVGWISIDRKNGNWEIFPKISCINLTRFWKVEGAVTSFHILRTSSPPSFMAHHCIYVDRDRGGQSYWYIVYIAFSLNTET